jgi:hypothetical protein
MPVAGIYETKFICVPTGQFHRNLKISYNKEAAQIDGAYWLFKSEVQEFGGQLSKPGKGRLSSLPRFGMQFRSFSTKGNSFLILSRVSRLKVSF